MRASGTAAAKRKANKMAYKNPSNAIDNLDAAILEFLEADVPYPVKNIGDLAKPGMTDLVKAAKNAGTLQRSLWRATNGRDRIVGTETY